MEAAGEAMGDLVPYRSPRRREEFTAYLGMAIFLASWAMMFGALFFAYGFVRARAGAWPPAGASRLPLLLPGINTAVLALSSAALHYGLSSVRQGAPRRSLRAIALSLLLGALFLALQFVVWDRVLGGGFQPSSGPYASVFYALTCFHALHVAVGLGALAWLVHRARAGLLTPARHLSLRLWTMYWHFVGIVWGIIFVTVYVL